MGIVRIWHSADASIKVPVTDILVFDQPQPSILVLETLSLAVTIEGIRLDRLVDALMQGECTDVRVTDGAPSVGDRQPVIRRVILTQSARTETGRRASYSRPCPSSRHNA